jgi:hypothetical protein
MNTRDIPANLLYVVKVFALLVVFGTLFSLVRPHHVFAITPDSIPDDLRPGISRYDTSSSSSCRNTPPQDYDYVFWGSPPGHSLTDTIKQQVAYGKEATVDLQLNQTIFLCKTIVDVDGHNYNDIGLPQDGTPTTDALTWSSTDTVCTHAANVTGMTTLPETIWPGSGCATSVPAYGNVSTPVTYQVNYDGNSRYWFNTPPDFTYTSPPVTFTTPQTIQVSLNVSEVENFYNGNYYCVDGGQAATGSPPSYGCGASQVQFDVLLTPTGAPPEGNLDTPTCTTITGWASDPTTTNPVYVDVYYNGGSEQRVLADLPYSGEGNHGFSTTVPAAFQESDSPVEVTAYAENATGGTQIELGNSPGETAICDHPPSSDLGTPTCGDGIYGWAFDADDSSKSVDMEAYVDGPKGGGGQLIYRPTPTSILNTSVNNAYHITGNHGFDIGVYPYAGYTARTYYVYADDILANGNPGPPANDSLVGVYTIGPCATFTCGSLSPPSIISGSAFTLTTNVLEAGMGDGGTPPKDPGGTYTVTVNGTTHTGYAVTPGTNVTIISDPINLDGSASAYNVTWSFTYNGVSSGTCNGSVAVEYAPYFRVYSGDVAVGDDFTAIDGTCNTRLSSIYGWPNPTLAAGNVWNGGAGSQFGELATHKIIGAASAANVAAPPQAIATTPTPDGGPPLGLSFANSTGYVDTTPGTDEYGGGFSPDSPDCMIDYFDAAPQPASMTPITSGPIPSSSGNYYSNGDINLTGGTLNTGSKVTIYVKGNVEISSSILYATPWNTVNDIPNFQLIVSGNITIDNAVGELDGIYVAQPTDNNDNTNSNGVIYTCETAPPGDIYDACANQLKIYGAFVARKVQLLRTYGNVSGSGQDDIGTKASEVFYYSPAMFGGDQPGQLSPNYDSIANLPPIP